MSEEDYEVDMLRDQVDRAADVIAEFRDAIATIYALNGEDPQIARLCDPLLTRYERGYRP